MFYFICLIILLLLSKKIRLFIKYIFLDKKIAILFTSLFVIITICFTISYVKKTKTEVDANTKKLVLNYIKEEYKLDCKIKSSFYTYHGSGFAGGNFDYSFTLKDSNNNIFYAGYIGNEILNEKTLSRLELKDKDNNLINKNNID